MEETSFRPDQTSRSLASGVDINSLTILNRQLRTENETLRREKDEIESKSLDEVRILKAQLRDKEEQ
ncbi:MAG: hypothetical protein EZS28_033252, partial [Streblomastix strix]